MKTADNRQQDIKHGTSKTTDINLTDDNQAAWSIHQTHVRLTLRHPELPQVEYCWSQLQTAQAVTRKQQTLPTCS